jgi:hypothetical protein
VPQPLLENREIEVNLYLQPINHKRVISKDSREIEGCFILHDISKPLSDNQANDKNDGTENCPLASRENSNYVARRPSSKCNKVFHLCTFKYTTNQFQIWLDLINPIRKKSFLNTAKLKPSRGFASHTYGNEGIVWAVSLKWRLATSCSPQYKVAVMCCHKTLLLGCLKYKETEM